MLTAVFEACQVREDECPIKNTATQNTSWGLTVAGRKPIAYWSMARVRVLPVQRRAHQTRFGRATPRRGSPLAMQPMWCSSTSTSKPEIFAAFTLASVEQDEMWLQDESVLSLRMHSPRRR